MAATLTAPAKTEANPANEYYADFKVRKFWFTPKEYREPKIGGQIRKPFFLRQLFLRSPGNAYAKAYRVTRITRGGVVSYAVFRLYTPDLRYFTAWAEIPETKWEPYGTLNRTQLTAFLATLGFTRPEATVSYWETLPPTKN